MKTAQRAAIAASLAVRGLSWQKVSGLLWQVQVTVRAGPYKTNEFAMNAIKTHTESHNYVLGTKNKIKKKYLKYLEFSLTQIFTSWLPSAS